MIENTLQQKITTMQIIQQIPHLLSSNNLNEHHSKFNEETSNDSDHSDSFYAIPAKDTQSIIQDQDSSRQQDPQQVKEFTSLTNSIDILFEKIQKIKSQFNQHLSEPLLIKPKSAIDFSNIQRYQHHSNKFIDSIPQISSDLIENQLKQNILIQQQKKIVDTSYNANLYKNFTVQNIPLTQIPRHQSTPQQLRIQNFELGRCIGSGKFGDVLLCRHYKTGNIFALKKILKSTITQYDMLQQLCNQLRIHYRLHHENIIKIYAHFDDEFHIFFLMEYAPQGMLMKYLQQSEEFVSRTLEQVMNAVEYMHRFNIVHRDIKPENIVLAYNGVVKVCDFGWACEFQNQMKTTFCGTLDYISPEMKDKGQYTNSVDLWSIGILTFELIVGFPAFKHEIDRWKMFGGRMQDKWRWGNLLFPPEVTPEAQSFITNLLKQNPHQRSTIQMCRNHAFITKHRSQKQQESKILSDLLLILER